MILRRYNGTRFTSNDQRRHPSPNPEISGFRVEEVKQHEYFVPQVVCVLKAMVATISIINDHNQYTMKSVRKKGANNI